MVKDVSSNAGSAAKTKVKARAAKAAKKALVRGDLVTVVAENSGITRSKANDIIGCVLETIAGSVQGGTSVKLKGFGSFVLHETPARPGRNPKTGDAVQIGVRKSMKFKASLELRDISNAKAA